MNVLIKNTIDIAIDGFKFKAKTWGDENTGNCVLAIHGWLDNANTFDKIAPLLSQNHYIVAIDLAGHGLSGHRSKNSSYYLWDYAMDVLNCMDTLKWETCTILAHSMGTGVASIVASAFPDRVSKLVFIDGLGAPFITSEDNTVSNFKNAFQQLKMAKKTRLFGFTEKDTIMFKSKEEAIKERMHSKISPISYEAATSLVDRGLKPISGGFRWSHDPKIVFTECYKMTESQVLQFIKRITCETLIILGKQGLFTTESCNSRLQAFKKAKIHWVDGNHHLHLENEYHTISKLIHQFL